MHIEANDQLLFIEAEVKPIYARVLLMGGIIPLASPLLCIIDLILTYDIPTSTVCTILLHIANDKLLRHTALY